MCTFIHNLTCIFTNHVSNNREGNVLIDVSHSVQERAGRNRNFPK